MRDVNFAYDGGQGLRGVSLRISAGSHVAIVGQDCIPEALEEMTRANSPFIGSVSHEVNTYGARLIHLGLAMIKGDRIPPYNYVTHKLVTTKSILTSV